jgi:tetraacyldisaccharide 4'-kinase
MRRPDFWEADGLLPRLLSPLSLAWSAAGAVRWAFANPYRAPVPVICVGNLVAGGAGKTPVAIDLAQRLGAAVVTRGYGGSLAGPVRVEGHEFTQVGDEALLLARVAPTWVARDRAAGVRAAAEAGASAVVLDDGFQNPSVAKDLSLVVLDGLGNGRVMPAGPLREPVQRGLERADAVVLMRSAGESAGLGDRPVLRARIETVNGNAFPGRRLVAFAGIGRPEKFFHTLEAIGADLVARHRFPDHHAYREAELLALRRPDATLVTTAKDAVRLPPTLRSVIEVLEVRLVWGDEAALASLLRTRVLSRAA